MQILLLALLVAATPADNSGTSSPLTSSPQPLQLADFLQRALANNPGVERILTQRDIAEGALLSSQGISDPMIAVGAAAARVEPNGLTPLEPGSSNDLSFNMSVDYLLAETGTRASLLYGNRLTNRKPAHTTLGSDYFQPSVTLRLVQPLLKNRGGIQDSLAIRVNEKGRRLADLRAREQIESFVTSLAMLYLDWHQAHREVLISEEVHNQAIEQEKLIRLKVARQVAEAHELYRMQELREDYFARWRQALGRFEGLSQQIAKQMLDDAGSAAIPVAPEDTQLRASGEVAGDYLISDSRLKMILDTLVEQQSFIVDAKHNALQADLGLALQASRHGVDPSFADAHTGSLNNSDIMLLLDYRFPVGNRRAEGAHLMEVARLRQLKADMGKQLLDAEAIRADLDAQQKRFAEALEATDRKIALAERKLKEERRLYRIGRLDSFELIQDQKAQLETRLVREQRYVQLQRVRLLLGDLLDQNLTHLTDHDLFAEASSSAGGHTP